ncbi:MAG: hypothetical protein CMK43_04645 [Porticoccaceae bacterium]|nr:hypothetical protein [Porticoccaceae bacterium]
MLKKRYTAILLVLIAVAVITEFATRQDPIDNNFVHLACDRIDIQSENAMKTVISIHLDNKTMTWNGGTFDNLIVNEHQYQIRAVPRDQCKGTLSCPDSTMIVNRITLVASRDRYKGSQQDRNRRYQCIVSERI